MAKRVRSHILEDESRVAFMNILPPEWVYRDKDKDYGIDCEVEVFEKDGTSTGIVFWVQLKATDSINEKTNKTVTFDKSKILQFYNYEIPILIVRYISSEKVFYFKWAREIIISDESKNRISVKFTNKNRWDENTSNVIRKYLNLFSVIKNRKLKFPIPIYISNESLKLTNTNPRVLTSNLKLSLDTYNRFVTNCKSIEEALLTIELNQSYIFINLNTLGRARIDVNLNETAVI